MRTHTRFCDIGTTFASPVTSDPTQSHPESPPTLPQIHTSTCPAVTGYVFLLSRPYAFQFYFPSFVRRRSLIGFPLIIRAFGIIQNGLFSMEKFYFSSSKTLSRGARDGVKKSEFSGSEILSRDPQRRIAERGVFVFYLNDPWLIFFFVFLFENNNKVQYAQGAALGYGGADVLSTC